MKLKKLLNKITEKLNTIFFIILVLTLFIDAIFFHGNKFWRIILIIFVGLSVEIIYRRFLHYKYKEIYNGSIIFIFLSMYMGNVLNIYRIIMAYDKILHFISGMIICYSAIEIYKNVVNINTKTKIFFVFVISFSIGCAGLWEIYEFTTDKLFGFTSQNNSLSDTMLDMINGTLGSLIMFFIYIKMIKNSGKNK